ncbi:MarR family winged helix-turn-helix transcriptional regulator [Mycobacterium ulcerans]|uniref:MarR family winged helix-turn-helix transcriptional regulator n=1 Tax=Mycobacterium ulcerans TaxID=1809 RepID=UPI00106BCAE5|nr:MarR family transcriptional regulator [Mycobacterium ulcerans]
MSGTRKVPQLPQPIETTRQETLKWVAASAPGLAVDDAELGTALFAGSVRLVRTVESHLQRYGLSFGRFAVLITLGAAPEGRHTPSAIAERIAVRRPTVTGIVNGLESAGLVRRSADPTSRRNQLVELTERGRRLVAEIAPDHFGRLAAAMGEFTPAERDTLRAAMGLLDRFGEVLLDERDA